MRARALAFSAALGALALLAACTTGTTDGGSTSEPPTLEAPVSSAGRNTTPASPAPLPSLEVLPSTDVTVDGAPGAVLWAHGAVWVMSHRSTMLRRIDPSTVKVTAQVDTGVLGCGDIKSGAGSLWVSGCSPTPGLVRVDPGGPRVVSTHGELNGLGPGFHGGDLWIASGSGGMAGLSRGDPERLQEAHEVPVVGLGVDAGVVEAAGSVWVADNDAVVYRVDPETEQVLAAVPLPLDSGQPNLITHDGAPWYVDNGIGAVARVDPATNAPTVLALRPVRPPEYRGVAASSAPDRASRALGPQRERRGVADRHPPRQGDPASCDR